MKLFAAVALVTLTMAASVSYAEQLPAQNNAHQTMLMPSASNQSPFDFNIWPPVAINQMNWAYRITTITIAKRYCPAPAGLFYCPIPSPLGEIPGSSGQRR